jgi:two-component system, chemotaxis family, CheB/CheR fusion protein
MAVRRSTAGTRTAQARKGRAPRKRAIVKREIDFPVVAIGASAGGLDAMRTLFAALPAASGMAFIAVLHLDPIHPSKLVELLSAYTAMTVLEAREGMPVQPDHVYIIPPGRFLAVRSGALHLAAPPGRQTVRMPFDVLLRSLAEAIAARAVCIILSGTASDGSAGARAIKEMGGLVIAQNPEEAEYDGMPRSAMATGAVDFVLPLAQMPGALAKYAGHRYVRSGKSAAVHALAEKEVTKVIDLLRQKTPHDFALYKQGTLGRRIERRMAMAGIEDSDRYLVRLAGDPFELQNLANDLLINVTRFFRDAEVFELLKEKIVPELVRAQPPDRPIRIWVPGCSTGEEAYSIAMLFLEEIAAAQRRITLQIFATDIDTDAVQFAREGLYPAAIEADVAPARLTRFFVKDDRGYRVSRELRAAVVLSVHDLTADAPFSRLDLISCRNLLIYLRPEAQKKVLSVFHFALHEGGILLLGPSEGVGDTVENFEPIFKKQRIYRHIGQGRPGEVRLPLGRGEAARAIWLRPVKPAGASAANFREIAQRALVEAYAPASVLLNQKHQGLYYFGPIDLYLRMPQGPASQDLLAEAREGLRPVIRKALERASQGEEQTVTLAGRMKRNGSTVAVTVSARPVKHDGQDMILLSFLDAPKQPPEAAVELPAEISRIAQIEQELDITRKDLEIALRDRETAEDEIRAINEEAMSVNEEFQTTNEELETSKEELQSLNEELMALNSQLQETVDQNQIVANDLENILNSTLVATLFLDTKFNIRFFTPAAKSLFSVIASDIGRPLSDLAHHFADGNLFADTQTVLANLVPVTREFVAKNGAWFTCRILPYRTKDNRIEGVVITFVDITERKRLEEAWNTARLQAESANLGKSRFLAAASHDLRQPLQTLGFLQELLAMKIKDTEQLRLVALCEESLAAMSGMLNTLLDINQLEAGVIRPNLTNFPVSQLLDHLKSEFAYHTQTHGLGWRVLPCRFAVRSDFRLLEQMIRNLLSNAVKYTKKGRILLGCRRHGDRLRIEVWDTGLGIPEGQLRAIFQEFHQLDNPAREQSKGLGLGLAIVQRLGDLLGHTVDVHSRVGRGSVFSIEVPLAPAETPQAPKERESEKVTARSGSILIVEDDPAVRFALESLLRADGHRVTAAADDEEAIELVTHKGARPDVVIVDYDLPKGVTGLDVMTRLRGAMGRPVPALVLTGDIAITTLSEISRQGYAHRSKPIRAKELTRFIRSLLGEQPESSPKQAKIRTPRSSASG